MVFDGHGIFLGENPVNKLTIENCTFQNLVAPLSGEPMIKMTKGANNLTIQDNLFQNLRIEGGIYMFGQPANDLTIVNNTFKDVFEGVHLLLGNKDYPAEVSNNIVVSDNTFVGVNRMGIEIQGHNFNGVEVIGNKLSRFYHAQAETYALSIVPASSHNILVQGNQVLEVQIKNGRGELRVGMEVDGPPPGGFTLPDWGIKATKNQVHGGYDLLTYKLADSLWHVPSSLTDNRFSNHEGFLSGRPTYTGNDYTDRYDEGVWFIGSDLIIAGTDDPDDVYVTNAVGGGVEVYLNGSLTPADIAKFDRYGDLTTPATSIEPDRIIVYTYGDDDTIEIDSAVTIQTYLDGGIGSDTITGGSGDDIINGGAERDIDVLTGGAGRDMVDYSGRSAADGALDITLDSTMPTTVTRTISGVTTNEDTIEGFEDARGGEGNDTITGDAGDNRLFGGLGNDTLIGGDGNDWLNGGDGLNYENTGQFDGNDSLDGGNGVDTLAYTGRNNIDHLIINLGAASAGLSGTEDQIANFENAHGGYGNDTFIGNSASNIFYGGGGRGQDTVSFAGLSDNLTIDLSTKDQAGDLWGDNSIDMVGSGVAIPSHGTTDILFGIVNIIGGSGNDTITGDDANNRIEGGAGADTIVGGNGHDELIGGDGNDTIRGGDGVDTIAGGDGDDTIRGGIGADILDGGAGTNTLDFSDHTTSVTITLPEGTNTISGGTDTIKQFTHVIGGSGNDTITGNSAANTISGGDGDDTIQGGAGTDVLDGGAGTNTLDFSDHTTSITIVLPEGTATSSGGTDTIKQFTNVIGGSGNDTITGNSVANTLSGGDGDDVIGGSGGNDTLNGGDGADKLYGDAGDDTLNGGDGADQLSGGIGADYLDGGAGDDTLDGGVGVTTYATIVGTDYKVGLAGDFNGDGNQDIVFRNISTGANTVWYLDATGSLIGSDPLPTVAMTDWYIGGSADFNGDGKTDLIWRRASIDSTSIWYMNGTAVSGSPYTLPYAVSAAWKASGTGDMDGDLKPDILWRNETSGDNTVWRMDGVTRLSSSAVANRSGAAWKLVGAADFNGDRKGDMVWNQVGTTNSLVGLSGGTPYLYSDASLPAVSGPTWLLGGAGDYNHDGFPDLRWRQSGGGAGGNTLWKMTSLLTFSASALNPTANLDWKMAVM